MATSLVCRACGTDLRAHARFCDQCGIPISAAGSPAKYKQVTVLFTDVVRSMDLAARVDLERLRDIMTRLFERSASVVRRYGGTMEHTGDGVMALFGAPVAVEDHAFRACLAALDIQQETNRLATEIDLPPDVLLQVRVGLNSGLVIAGDVGSGALGYTATGETIGFAQRMESVAPAGGIVLSETTARLVEDTAILAAPHWVHIKGSDKPVCVRRLEAMSAKLGPVHRAEVSLVGRRWEMATLDAIMNRAISGHGGVIHVSGPPGIGKSRIAREAASRAAGRGVAVYWTFCESHAQQIPFHTVTGLLRSRLGISRLPADAARDRARAQAPGADPQDLLVLDDLLGIGDPATPPPQIDPDARRRRLAAVLKTMTVARTQPALVIVEDAQWIDAVSDSMVADFLADSPETPSLILVTSRPDYAGALTRMRDAQAITLAPLSNSDVFAMVTELVGSDLTLGELPATIVDRAGGNPFFAEEMVRELAQRGVLSGARGAYLCHHDVTEVSVPATVQTAIEARIDRLDARSKRTLNAAAVIGARFEAELVTAVRVDAAFDDLIDAELIDQVSCTSKLEFTFHHPLIRAVAYESQLKSDRAHWHRQLAAAIEERAPAMAEDNAALIAGHLEAAGDMHAAYSWHMRAAASLTNRDLDAARLSWERARCIADALPADDPNHLAMCIAPRTMLCVTDWHPLRESPDSFAELRALCEAAGDNESLAVAMTGPATVLLYTGRSREGSQVSSEQMVLLDSLGDPAPLMGLAFIAFANWCDSGEAGQILRWSQTVIDLADGDSTKGGDFGLDSPLAVALAWRGYARWWLGRSGWRHDIEDALAIARSSCSPTTLSAVVAWTYGLAIQYGVLRCDNNALRTAEASVHAAAGSSNDVALRLAEYTLGVALLNRDAPADRGCGLSLMAPLRDWFLEHSTFLVPVVELWCAREQSRQDLDGALPAMRRAVDELHDCNRLGYAVWGFGVLTETLLERGTAADVAEAEQAIDRLTALRADRPAAAREMTLLRLHALLARAQGEAALYRKIANRYHLRAKSLAFEGHLAAAEAMLADCQ